MSLKEAIKVLEDAVVKTSIYFDGLDPADIPLLLTSYKELKEKTEAIVNASDALAKITQKISYVVIPEALQAAGFDSCKVKGYNYIVSVRTNASIPKNKQKEGFEWLRENGFDALIQEAVNAKSLSSAMTSFIEDKGIQPPDDVMTIHRQAYTSIRKA